MHMLRGVLQIPLSLILVFGGEDRDGLEPAPAEGENDGVVGLEDLREGGGEGREGGRGGHMVSDTYREAQALPLPLSLPPSLPCDATDASSPYTAPAPWLSRAAATHPPPQGGRDGSAARTRRRRP